MKKIFKNKLGLKFGFVLFLFVLLQIPVSMVSNLIEERAHRQDEVKHEIARSSSGEQRIIGPFISVEYSQTTIEDDKRYRTEYRQFILPEVLDLSADLDSFEKHRGIYSARLYKATTALKGSFDLSSLNELNPFDINKITMVVGVEDSRGLIRLDNMTLAGEQFELSPGTGINKYPQGFHARLLLNELDTTKPLDFDFNFLLQGMGKLLVTPIGDKTSVKLSSAWPHPSFVGDYLPVSSDISEAGFKATWASNNFSTNISQLFEDCLSNTSSCYKFDNRQMGVELVDPVDHYLKSHRAVNYSLLIITLVFASFFLLELFQARPIHPVQYGFVGLALALFYLLLISLSEHIGFNWAYLVSALGSTALLSIYVVGMLANHKQSFIFGASLLALYAMLFGLLLAESYALLMGTLLCFAILSFVMILTRNVDWYGKSKKVEVTDEEFGDE